MTVEVFRAKQFPEGLGWAGIPGTRTSGADHEKGRVKSNWPCHLCNWCTPQSGPFYKVVDYDRNRFRISCADCVYQDYAPIALGDEACRVIVEDLANDPRYGQFQPRRMHIDLQKNGKTTEASRDLF